MKTTFRLMCATVLAMWALCPIMSGAAEDTLISFSLEGQDGKTYTEQSWAGQALVLFLSTRESAVYNEGRVWSSPVVTFFRESPVADTTALVRIANISAVPRLFRGAAKSMVLDSLKPADDDPVRLSLLDWNAEFAKHYGAPDDSYNILVFDTKGQLVFRTALQKFDQQKLDVLLLELAPVAAQL